MLVWATVAPVGRSSVAKVTNRSERYGNAKLDTAATNN